MTDFAIIIGPDGSWTSTAACLGMDTDLFFSDAPADVKQAKSICVGCPVRTPCLVAALERGERYGVWGGHTTEEREQLLKRPA